MSMSMCDVMLGSMSAYECACVLVCVIVSE